MNVLDNNSLFDYYQNDLKISKYFHGLNDGLLKPYTTNGFMKSVEMWNEFSHESFEAFLNDFLNKYSIEYLRKNCDKCYEKLKSKYPEKAKKITYEMLFDKLFYKLVVDCFIGHACENEIYNYLNKHFENKEYCELCAGYNYEWDVRYGIDIVVYDKDKNVKKLIQVKNKTFFIFSKYSCNRVKDQLKKEKLFRIEHPECKDIPIYYYVYDKDTFLNDGKFFIFNNMIRKDNDCRFLLSDFIDNNYNVVEHDEHMFDNNDNGMYI